MWPRVRGVRNQKIEETALFTWRLLHEEPVDLFGEFENSYTGIDVGPIHGPVDLDQVMHLIKLGPDLRSLPVVRLRVDPPVETVVVEDAETVIQLRLLSPETGDATCSKSLVLS